MSNPTDRWRRGFTLLEILLAVTILGIILTTVYGSLSRTLHSKRIAEQQAELFANGREAVLKMVSEIEGALHPRSGDRVYLRGAAGNGRGSTLEFIAMNRGGYGLNRVRPGRVRISYWLESIPGMRGISALFRSEESFAVLLAEADGIALPQDDEEEDDAAPPWITYPLLDCPDTPNDINLAGVCTPVVGMHFRYFDEAAGDWRDEWDTTAEATLFRLPSAIEIELLLADERGREHYFGTIVDLPLARGQPTPRPGETAEEADEEEFGEDGDDDDSPGVNRRRRGRGRRP